MKRNKSNGYFLLFFFVTGIVMMVLRNLINPVIPTPISFGIGAVILGYGLILSILEIKHQVSASYAYAENWNGGGFINSGVILGISIFFFAADFKIGLLLFVLLNVMLLVKWKVKSSVAR